MKMAYSAFGNEGLNDKNQAMSGRWRWRGTMQPVSGWPTPCSRSQSGFPSTILLAAETINLVHLSRQRF